MMHKEVAGPVSRQVTNVDAHVGRRVRARRILVGMSQEQLAERLGLTFQQVQKYEKGINRISASKLQQIADALGVCIQFFFSDEDAELDAGSEPTLRLLQDRDAVLLLRAFSTITDTRVRRAILSHVQALATIEPDQPKISIPRVEGLAKGAR